MQLILNSQRYYILFTYIKINWKRNLMHNLYPETNFLIKFNFLLIDCNFWPCPPSENNTLSDKLIRPFKNSFLSLQMTGVFYFIISKPFCKMVGWPLISNNFLSITFGKNIIVNYHLKIFTYQTKGSGFLCQSTLPKQGWFVSFPIQEYILFLSETRKIWRSIEIWGN
jgi:hypothetical protein